MSNKITNSNEFLLVHHSVLNNRDYNIEQLVEESQKLEKHINGKKPVLCLEGDIIQLAETGEIVLTHKNFSSLSQKDYINLKEVGIATSFDEMLNNILEYQLNNDQKVVLCLEAKSITTDETIKEVVRKIKEHSLDNVYFDSFFGGKLDIVQEANKKYNTDYQRSLHLISNFRNIPFMMTEPKKDYDLLTVPHTTSFGKLNSPVIYGAVGSIDALEKITDEENSRGAYLRLKEGSGLKGALVKLFNSVSNTEKYRKH